MPDPQLKLEALGVVTPGVWTDITSRLYYGEAGTAVEVDTGGQTELSDADPSHLTGALENDDGAFNPANSSSPFPGWDQGTRVRLTETVDGLDFRLFTGPLEAAGDVVINRPGQAQPLQFSAVDLLGQLENAPKFEGTLAEHIRTNGGTLVEWFPLSDQVPFASAITSSRARLAVFGYFDVPVPAEPTELVRAADAEGPPGDDVSYAHWTPVGTTTGGSFIGQAEAHVGSPFSVTVGAADTIAVSIWVRLDPWATSGGSSQPNYGLFDLTPVAVTGPRMSISVGAGLPVDGYPIRATVVHTDGTTVQSVTVDTGHPLSVDLWRLVTVRVNFSTGVVEVMIGADSRTVGSIGLLPSRPAATMDVLTMGSLLVGALGQFQVRVGAGVMTPADHIAQHRHGYTGLDRQTVAERITTLAGYAGVQTTDLALPATASTPLRPAKLSGKQPLQEIRDTATSGQDTVLTKPTGEVTILPRSQRYGQTVAMSIPFGWIEARGLKYRVDKPLNEISVTHQSGAFARRSDRVSQAAKGVSGVSVTLDSAVEADVSNLADWLFRTYDRSRTRAPLIRISMLRRTIAQRQALLGLRVGDRIQITTLPTGSPDDVGHLIVRGIKHIIGPGLKRLIEFKTGPLLGPSAGVAPVCARVGSSVVGASTRTAY